MARPEGEGKSIEQLNAEAVEWLKLRNQKTMEAIKAEQREAEIFGPEVLKRKRAKKKPGEFDPGEISRPRRVRKSGWHPHVYASFAWTQILAEAGALIALPLLQAIACEMTVSKKKAVLIKPRIWLLACADTNAKRKTMLLALKRVPDLIRIGRAKSTAAYYYARQGPMWGAKFTWPKEEEKFD